MFVMAWECLSSGASHLENDISSAEVTFCFSSLLAKSHSCPFVLLALICIISLTPQMRKKRKSKTQSNFFPQTFHTGFLKRKPGLFTETHTLCHAVEHILSVCSSNIFVR